MACLTMAPPLLLQPAALLCIHHTHSHVVYHGAVAKALPFFNSLGFECPQRKDVPSFLQEVATSAGAPSPPSTSLPSLHTLIQPLTNIRPDPATVRRCLPLHTHHARRTAREMCASTVHPRQANMTWRGPSSRSASPQRTRAWSPRAWQPHGWYPRRRQEGRGR
jgi:hypothetical protein